MAFDSLKNAIKQVIKTNGNNEITGEIMQSTLLTMINELSAGWVYAGVATPDTAPGKPDNNVFYVALAAGTYVNFGNTPQYKLNGNEIGIFKNNATGFWECDIISLKDIAAATKTLAYSQLDTFGFDELTIDNVLELMTASADGAPLRYHVTPLTGGLCEGVLEMWFDSMSHVIAQRITTAATLDEDTQQFTSMHTDFTQSTYIRYLNLAAPSSPVERMKWTKWQIYESTNSSGYKYVTLELNNPPTTSEKVYGLVDGGETGRTLEKYLDPNGTPIAVDANTTVMLLSQWDRLKQENRWLKSVFPASRRGIAIKNITFTPVMADILTTLYEDYTACAADTSSSVTWNNKAFNPLKLTNEDGEQENTNLWGWGDFIISQGKLKNQSPGVRSLAITRTKAANELRSIWQNGDKIIITRTSSEPVSVEAVSSLIKLTTDGMVDTIEFTTNSNIMTDAYFLKELILSIPRDTYIESIEIRYVDKVAVNISFMDGRAYVFYYQYRTAANGKDVEQLQSDMASVKTDMTSVKNRVSTLEKNEGSITQSISQLKTAAQDVLESNAEVIADKDHVDLNYKDINYADGDGFFSDDKSFTLPAATEEKAGVMSAEDKKKLNKASTVGKAVLDSKGEYSNEIFNDYVDNSNSIEGGYSNHVEGYDNHVVGNSSANHIEGGANTVSGWSNHCEGENNTITNNCSYCHAEGESNTIEADECAHAEGYGCHANSNFSHAEGSYTIANNEAEHAQGRLNKSNTGSTDAEKTIHSIGIGVGYDDSDRKNAVEVMTNGDVYVIGIGGYDGTNPAEAQTLQEVINKINI